jgi:hypothetical protein
MRIEDACCVKLIPTHFLQLSSCRYLLESDDVVSESAGRPHAQGSCGISEKFVSINT